MSHSEEYNKLVPNEIFDIEDSDEIAEAWLSSELSNPGYGKINPCMDCGAEIENLDNEICDNCWELSEKRLERLRQSLRKNG